MYSNQCQGAKVDKHFPTCDVNQRYEPHLTTYLGKAAIGTLMEAPDLNPIVDRNGGII